MKFSVIVPVYNAEKSIIKCVDCIINQSFTDWELLLIDDGSKDNSLFIINRLALTDGRIKVIHQDNQGAGAARNKGIDSAIGDYVAFLDSDDLWNRDYLLEINEIICKDNSDVVFVDIIREKTSGKIIRQENMSSFATFSKNEMIRQQMTGKMPWGCVRKVVRNSILQSNHIRLATNIKVGEESFYSFQVLEKANVISFQPKALYHYIENDASLTAVDVPENSQKVFDFFVNQLEISGKYHDYKATVAAFAITTICIQINLVSKSDKGFFEKYKKAKRLITMHSKWFTGTIDTLALEKRVLVCYPWVKLCCPTPIIIASKLQDVRRKWKQ